MGVLEHKFRSARKSRRRAQALLANKCQVGAVGRKVRTDDTVRPFGYLNRIASIRLLHPRPEVQVKRAVRVGLELVEGRAAESLLGFWIMERVALP